MAISSVFFTESAVPPDDPSLEAGSPWVLEGVDPDVQHLSTRLHRLPFRVGRQKTNDLQLPFTTISRLHAEILEHGEELWIRDCASTNGTFLNHQRLLQAAIIKRGDIVHFGPLEFRLERDGDALSASGYPLGGEESIDTQELDGREDRLIEMLRQRSVVPLFQPIIRLGDGQISGYEILGRCNVDGLPRSPLQLLSLADSIDKQAELSELFREVGLQQATLLGNRQTLFLNAAPNEIEAFRLAVSLTTLRQQAPDLPLVLEINEKAVASRSMLVNLRAMLNDLCIGLAYDDFGVGQARLLEIIDVPPDWLKFDLMLVQSLRRQHSAEQPERTIKVLRAMLQMTRDLGIKTVAEGIETEADMEACKALGFDVGQGYFLGRPQPFFL